MKISLAPVQRPRISVSVRFTCLPGRLPRTSSSFVMTSSTSNEELAIAPPSDDEPAAEDQLRLRHEQGFASRKREIGASKVEIAGARRRRCCAGASYSTARAATSRLGGRRRLRRRRQIRCPSSCSAP